MAITQHILSLLKKLSTEGKFENARSVMEMGSQYVLADYMQVCGFFNDLGIRHDAVKTRQIMNAPKISSRFIYEHLGFTRFAAIDFDQILKPLKFDLNEDLIQKYNYTETFDLVTNLGMSEHIMNQDMFFRNVHRLTNQNGLMLHVVPVVECNNHGLFHYTPLFFKSLATMNDYGVEGTWLSLSESKDSDYVVDYSDEEMKRLYGRAGANKEAALFLAVLYRKKKMIDFVRAYDEVIFCTVHHLCFDPSVTQTKGAC